MIHPHAQPLADLFGFLLPEMILVLGACILFVGGLFKSDRYVWSVVAVGAIFLALTRTLSSASVQSLEGGAVFGVPFLFDSLAQWTRVVALLTGLVFLLLCWHDVPEKQVADHHACFLVILAGVSLVGASNDLVALFLSLEMISIPTYILLYLPKHDDDAQEASIKYFLLSVFSSGLLLFGFSYLFGLTGTTNIAGILQVLYGASVEEARAVSGLAQVAMLTIAAGLGFRITAVPFHFYAPDVFQGTSTSGAAFLSYVPKIAGFVALLRVFGFVAPAGVTVTAGPGLALSDQVAPLFWFLAALTMVIGNTLALLQDNLKRLLAYSSIAHAGYMLVALASAPYLGGADSPTSGVPALLFYLIAYGTMTLGIFAVIVMLHRPERPVETVDDLAGLAQSHPGTALLVTALLLSLIGFPLTVGFTGKFMIFFSAVSVQSPIGWLYPTLAVIGVLSAAVGAWYYLRIITMMYLRSAVKPIETRGNLPAKMALIACVALTFALSIPPGAGWILNGGGRVASPPAVKHVLVVSHFASAHGRPHAPREEFLTRSVRSTIKLRHYPRFGASWRGEAVRKLRIGSGGVR
ncbi:MAG: NADH-quinone oxidoreductase subunit N [Planctomycetes bacterium]|nr:NADH-quinone oxidoreductase subunit N [Planctomycetota bacterium]